MFNKIPRVTKKRTEGEVEGLEYLHAGFTAVADACKLAMPPAQTPEEQQTVDLMISHKSLEPTYANQNPYTDLNFQNNHKHKMSLNQLIDMDIHNNNEEIQKLMKRMKNSDSNYRQSF